MDANADRAGARQRLVSFFPILMLLLLVAAGCDNSPNETQEPEAMSEQARSYLNEALDIMQEHSVNRKDIDWPVLRKRAMQRAVAAEAQMPEDTYGIIKVALHELGDRHSFFLPPDASPTGVTSSDESFPKPEGMRLEDKFGYVNIPDFSGGGEAATEFADVLQGEIERVDVEGVCGWVVDLRKNYGGNMWPMLAGVGPVLGEGIAGFFVEPGGEKQAWSYVDGSSRMGEKIKTEVSVAPYMLERNQPPVAVLIGSQTASSGEAIAVSFRGREQTRFFGEATAGLSTANKGFSLSDGARIVLTTATFADRTGKLYGGPIQPDEGVLSESPEPPVGEDPVVETATGWLQKQTACTDRNP